MTLTGQRVGSTTQYRRIQMPFKWTLGAARRTENGQTFMGEKKEFDKAIADFTTAIHVNPMDQARGGLGDVYMCKGAWNDAIVNFTESLRLRPNDADLHFDRVWPISETITPPEGDF